MSSRVMWFGVAAPPLAWAAQLVTGWLLDEAHCGRGTDEWVTRGHLWQAVVSGVAIAVAAAGVAAAWSTWRAVQAGEGDARGRTEFLAVTSLSAALVFVLLTVITLAGVLSVPACRG
jgi:cell division protein FtsX